MSVLWWYGAASPRPLMVSAVTEVTDRILVKLV